MAHGKQSFIVPVSVFVLTFVIVVRRGMSVEGMSVCIVSYLCRSTDHFIRDTFITGWVMSEVMWQTYTAKKGTTQEGVTNLTLGR